MDALCTFIYQENFYLLIDDFKTLKLISLCLSTADWESEKAHIWIEVLCVVI